MLSEILGFAPYDILLRYCVSSSRSLDQLFTTNNGVFFLILLFVVEVICVFWGLDGE